MPKFLSFPASETPTRKIFSVTSFGGVDLTSAPSDIDARRSPDAPNMMPDSRGNPIKRTGFSVVGEYGGAINGRWKLFEHEIIHAGTGLFSDGAQLYTGMANERSTGQVIGDRLYIFDGTEAVVTDGEDAFPLSDEAYIPTVLISKNADFHIENGETITQDPGGAHHEAFNLIGDFWRESFYAPTGTETTFSLSEKGLSRRKVKAKVRDANGDWQDKVEDTDFTVDRENGKITFLTAVTAAPVVGEDNVILTAAKHFDGYPEKINRCRHSIAYGENGLCDRIFLCGNPDEPNSDRWCAVGDPTYWPDIYYSTLGSGETRIVGYSVLKGQLATHLNPGYDGRSVLLRESLVDDSGVVSFPVCGFLEGEEAVSPDGFVYMETEPLFLTARGVYALTPSDISDREYTQNRSYYINRVLCQEDLSAAVAGKWKQFYLIAAGGKLYLLDTSQKSYGAGEPLSAFQYECYVWENVPARVLWEEDGVLFFGDENGRVCRFADDLSAAKSYEDEGPDGPLPIVAYWTLPDFSGSTFWKRKSVGVIGVQAASYPQNRVVLQKRVNGIWSTVREWDSRISFFAWNAIKWSGFTWSGNPLYRTLTVRYPVRDFDRVGFRVVCDEKDRAFGLYGFSIGYTEQGRYKK